MLAVDPALDLAVSTADDQVAGYALFWFDPVTKVGMVEPMESRTSISGGGWPVPCLPRVSTGSWRVALRLKVGYSTDAARALYVGAGFRVTSTNTAYVWRRRL